MSLCSVLPLANLLGSLTSSSCCGIGRLIEGTLKQKRDTTLSSSASEAPSSKTSPVKKAMPRLRATTIQSVRESKYWARSAADGPCRRVLFFWTHSGKLQTKPPSHAPNCVKLGRMELGNDVEVTQSIFSFSNVTCFS